jgi:hypothetical protein
MPLTLNVGVSRKMGLPDHGSVGASCNLEFELDVGLLEKDLDAFHARVRGACVAARRAVHHERARLQAPVEVRGRAASQAPAAAKPRNGYASSNVAGNGHQQRSQPQRSRSQKPATASQNRAILSIADHQNVELAELLRQEFNVERSEHLSLRQASKLIDMLKAAAELRSQRLRYDLAFRT